MKSRRRLPAKGIYLFFLLAFVLLPQDALSSEAAIGKLTITQGSVIWKRAGSGKVFPARVGDNVYVGDVLETGKESRAQVVLNDVSSVNMSSGTSLRVNQYAFETKENRRTAIVRVLEGKARFVVMGLRKESAFRVDAAHAVINAGVADFVVVVSPEETGVVVLDGGVSVKNISNLAIGVVRLGSNQKTVIKENTPPAVPTVITSQQRRTYSKDARNF